MQTVLDSRLLTRGIKCRLSVKFYRLQTESKTQAGCKMQTEYRLQSWKGLYGKKSRKYM